MFVKWKLYKRRVTLIVIGCRKEGICIGRIVPEPHCRETIRWIMTVKEKKINSKLFEKFQTVECKYWIIEFTFFLNDSDRNFQTVNLFKRMYLNWNNACYDTLYNHLLLKCKIKFTERLNYTRYTHRPTCRGKSEAFLGTFTMIFQGRKGVRPTPDP